MPVPRWTWRPGWPVLPGILPIRRVQVPADLLAGVTLAALAIPQALGYAKIAGMPVVTGLYTLVLPMALFALVGASRHLVVAADSATAAILAAARAELAAPASAKYVHLPDSSRCSPADCCCWPGWPGSGSSLTSCRGRSWSDSWPASAFGWPSRRYPTCSDHGHQHVPPEPDRPHRGRRVAHQHGTR